MPSQLLRDLDRLHRHFRKIDRDDDVLNVQRFHAHSMKSLQRTGSALLVKPRAFLALGGYQRDSLPEHRPGKTTVRSVYPHVCPKKPALGIRWVIDQKPV